MRGKCIGAEVIFGPMGGKCIGGGEGKNIHVSISYLMMSIKEWNLRITPFSIAGLRYPIQLYL